MSQRTRVACIQVNAQDDLLRNIEAIEFLMNQAYAQGARFMALPENAYYMRGEETGTSYHMETHPGLLHACDWARRHGCGVLVGSIFVAMEDTHKWANRSVLVNERGEIVTYYDKIHLFDVNLGDGETYRESDRILHGEAAQLAIVPFGVLGMSVCYDVRFPYLFRDMACSGATVLAVPAAFAKRTGEAHWHVLLRARAIENGCYVIAPAQCGSHPKNRQTYGHSLIIDPWGNIIAEAGTEPCVVMADINPQQVTKVREQLPSLQHGRGYTLHHVEG